MLAEILIAQACAGLPHVDQRACVAALSAAGAQSHVSSDIELTERYVTNTARTQVTRRVSAKIIGTVGSVSYVVKVIREKAISGQLVPQRGIRPALTSTLRTDGGQIEMNWNF